MAEERVEEAEGHLEPAAAPRATVFFDIDAIVRERSALIQEIDRLRDFVSGRGVSIGEHIDEFLGIITIYFEHEERVMAMARYPMRSAHAREHRHLMDIITNALEAGREYGVSLDVLADNLMAMMKTHDEYFDQVMIDYLRKKYAC